MAPPLLKKTTRGPDLEKAEVFIVSLIRQQPGRRAEEIGDILHMKPRERIQLKKRLARLRKIGVVKTKGKARGTTYYTIAK